MYFHGAVVRRVVNVRHQGGLWFAVASHVCEGCNETKTARGFFNEERRVEVLNSNPDVLRMPEDLASNFCYNSTSLSREYCGTWPLHCGGCNRSHIDRGLDRTSYAIVTNNGRIKNFVVSLEHFTELVADGVD